MVVQGVIKPPPEIRAVADRTALYVAKNGRAFESRILNSDKGKTPKFSFLQPTSPFHAYYEEKVKFYEDGGTDEGKVEVNEEKKTAEETLKPEKTEKAQQRPSAIDPIAKCLLDQRSKILHYRSTKEEAERNEEEKSDRSLPTLPPAPTFQYTNIVAPASLSIAEVEAIQLVAQLTALDGKNGSFLSQLIHREWNNPRFAFAQPRHGHFPYFSSLVDAYRTILSNWTSPSTAKDYIKDLANNVDRCLEIAAYWAEYERDQEEQARNADSQSSVAIIDWQDFVVVETIDFGVHEIVDIMPPPPPPLPVPSHPASAGVDEDMDVSDEEEEQIRVVPTYQPKIAMQKTATAMVIDPITGKAVAAQDMPEHMRIQLLDPKWAEEKKKFQERQKDSNLVAGDVVADNLARFTQAIGESRDNEFLSESESKKKLEEANRILREQGQRATVGPTLPQPARVEPSRAAPTAGQVEPPAKRAKMQVAQLQAPTTTIEAPKVPQPPGFEAEAMIGSTEEPFAAIGTAQAINEAGPESMTLIPEADFAATLSKPEVTLQIRIPNDRAQIAWNFYGQIVAQTVNVMSTVKTVKAELAKQHLNDMPANKIQLRNPSTGAFLKDASTLASLNIGPTASLELVPRARGGVRK